MSAIDVELTCPECNETFKLNAQEVLNRIIIKCPKCDCYLSEEELKEVKIAIRYMMRVH